ncbi:nucleotide pyrophosphatase [Cellulomonas sp. NTE-D12]|nr:nucleotide pyrophosphatase [Cellulomonas sp. NTE-D12]
MAGALGVDLPGAAAARALLGLPSAERVCVVLVDGLGHTNLSQRSGHAPFLRSLLLDSAPLTTTFPSTTATAMGTFGTGLPPGRTAMLGYTVRDPATGRLGNLVSWTDLPPAETWQPERSVLGRLADAGVRVLSVGPARFEGSGLTRAALSGATYRPAESLDQRVDVVARELRRPGVAYLYWGDVDKVGHHAGCDSWEWGDALEALDAQLARLARLLPSGTLLLVTADHGMVDVDPSLRWDVAGTPALAEGVALVAGEPRALHLHLEPAAEATDVVRRWQDVLGDGAVVRTREEAVATGWFGVVADRVRPVIGDVVVATTGRVTVVDSRTQTPASLGLVGVHGSLTRQEMLVPCLVTQV